MDQSTSDSRQSFQAPSSGRRWGRYLVLGLLTLSCCFWSGVGAWLFAPLTPFLANHLSYVEGKAELLVPAQGGASTGRLSPNGRRLLLRWLRDGREELAVWDLSSDTRQTIGVRADRFCWLNNEQFIVYGGRNDREADQYFLVQAQDTSVMAATIFLVDQVSETQLHVRWQAAEQLYVLDTFSSSGYTVVTIEQGQPILYRGFATGSESIRIVDAFTQDIPHVRIPDRCDMPPQRQPVYSPDGRYYTRSPDNTSQPIRIYTREGQVVAEAGKTGWGAYLLGWAHDSSGIYFQIKISGSAAAGLVPYQPIFKLSPLTPEEERWLIAQRIGLGVGIVAALLGGGWWWRRRHSR